MTKKLGPGAEDYGTTLPRPVVEQLAAASPHVTGHAVMQGWKNIDQYMVGEQEFSLNLIYGIHDFLSVFKPTVIVGDLKDLNKSNNGGIMVLPRSEAMRMFGTTDVAGKTLKYKWEDDAYINICAVIEDYPDNNFLHGACFIGINSNEGNYQNWNYEAYIRVDDVANLPMVLKAMRQTALELFKEDFNLTDPKEADALQVILTPVADTHFSKDLSKNSPGAYSVNRSFVYLLIWGSILWWAFLWCAPINNMLTDLLNWAATTMSNVAETLSSLPFATLEWHPNVLTTLLCYAALLTCTYIITRKMTSS
jgi:hypothetical protein